MEKSLITSGILFVVLVIFSVLLLEKETTIVDNQPANSNSEIILFYGEECPHCAIVDKYVEENKVKDIVSFEEKEVYHNKANANQLAEKAKICDIPTNSIGVPFLWTGEVCLVGDKDIIEFFKSKISKQ